MLNYIFASNKSWHLDYFLENRQRLKGNWSIATCGADVEEQAHNLNPRFIFFPHWSEIVPSSLFDKYECVCFHMTDVPYGRGGSPLQNLIVRGHKNTVISALKMNRDIDAGPVYMKRELELSGSASTIFKRSAPICFEMITQIIAKEITPTEQVGEPKLFSRRLPEESEIPQNPSIEKLYDIIRMLDAPGYPSAFLIHNGLKVEFSDANKNTDNELYAKVKVTKHG